MAEFRPDPSPTAPLGDEHSGETHQIGPYTLIREIGRGGMGVVYEARQRNPRRVVAVKVLSRGLDDPVAVERFRREANVLARLSHPNIAVVFEADVAPWNGMSVPFYAMEYISGGRTLGTYLRESGHSIRDRLALLIDLCSAVHHGHTRGVLHRDLKPANVLIDADGRLKLIDFGVARVLADIDNPLRTSGDAVIGTIQYMSPEQISGDVHAIDAKSDLYSLGVIAWELLTGKLPYEVGNRTIVQAAHLIHSAEPPPFHTADTALDAELEPILRRALTKQREQRHASVGEFANELRKVIGISPVKTTAHSRRYDFRKRLSPSLWSTIGVVVLATLAGTFAGHQSVVSLPPGHAAQRLLNLATMKFSSESVASNVTVVGVEDEPSIAAAATQHGIEGVNDSTSGRRTMRLLYGPLLTRLVEGGASVVALDLIFRGPSEFDGELVKGLQVARARDVPVVAAMADWDSEAISQNVAKNVRQLGGVTGGLNNGAGAWMHNLAARRTGRSWLPSLALLAAMCKLDPSTDQIEIALQSNGRRLEVSPYRLDPASPGGRIWSNRIWQFDVEAQQLNTDEALKVGLPPGSELILYPLNLPNTAEREQAFLSAVKLLELSADELKHRVAGKIVLIADFRNGADPRRLAPDGTMLPAAYSQVMAIHALLGACATRPATVPILAISACLGALAGAALSKRFSGSNGRLFSMAVVAILVATAACVLLQLLAGISINPTIPGTAMLVAAAAQGLLMKYNVTGDTASPSVA